MQEHQNFDQLFRIVLEDLGAKRQPFSKNAKAIMKSFKDKIGETKLREIAKEILQDENEVEKIMKAFVSTTKQDNSKGFRDFLKKKKSAKQKKDEGADEVFV